MLHFCLFIVVTVLRERGRADAIEDQVSFSDIRYFLACSLWNYDSISLHNIGSFQAPNLDSSSSFYNEINFLCAFQMVLLCGDSRHNSGAWIDTALSPEEISPQFSKTKQRSGVKNSFDEVAFTIFGFLSLNRLLDAYAFLKLSKFFARKRGLWKCSEHINLLFKRANREALAAQSFRYSVKHILGHRWCAVRVFLAFERMLLCRMQGKSITETAQNHESWFKHLLVSNII